ncbi:cytochrome c-type biogenesis CcmF C-terminal domain-containing protein, partial [Micromonospora sp. ATA51]|uniref:cytochrome c-type biogenesis CcmF C-terminal domain-containing protein n=1 Tax=Micromonospora sp. ATA51 TaxID=2806098 RepID=UPI0028154C39
MPVIETGLLRDTYVTLIAVSPDDGSATLRLAVNPLVGLLWAGGALTAVGGLGSAIGAARPRRRAGTPGEEARPASVGVHAGAAG